MRVLWLTVLVLGGFETRDREALAIGLTSAARNSTNGQTIGSDSPHFLFPNIRCNENYSDERVAEITNDEPKDEPVNLPPSRIDPTTRSFAHVNWITQLMSVLEPLPDNLQSKCRKHMETYVREINNYTDWAVRMMDAGGKFPSSVLMGNLRSMGDFDACLWIEPDDDIEPQYCLTTVYNFNVKDTFPMHEKLQNFVDAMTMGRMNLETKESAIGVLPMQRSARIEWATCVPASCSSTDVELIMISASQRLFPHADIRLKVHKKDCYTNGPRSEFSLRDRLIVTGISLIVVAVIVATLRDRPDGNNNESEDEKQLFEKISDAFSLKRSWKRLTDFSETNTGGKQIDCLDGLRGISSIWVAAGHMALLAASNPYVDKVTFFNTQKRASLMVLWNFFLPVDTFLTIGGLVRTYTLIASLEKRSANHWKNAATRYFRLTPALLVVVGFYLAILDRIGSGPLWNRHVGLNKLSCEWNWWKTILYVNNYIGKGDEGYHMCMLQSWYTAVDMQFYLLAPFIIVPIWKNPKMGFSMLAALAAICTSGQYFAFITNKLPGLPITMHSPDSAVLDYVRTFYFASHMRAMPYLIGIVTGYITYYHSKIQMSQPVVILGWMLTVMGLYWPLIGAMEYLDVKYPLGTWTHAFFGSMHKSIWAMAMSWIIFACHNGYGGFVNTFLSSNVLKFFSRISYSVFVTHLGVLVILTGYMRSPKKVDFLSTVKDISSDMTIIIIASILLHLFVEEPFSQLAQMIFRKPKKVEKKVG